MTKHTPGPWRWELNEKHKNLQLVGGRPMFDLTVLEPQRWGMGSATLFFRDTAEDGYNILHRVHERRDWIAPHAGRAHHATWCADLSHPDARLIAAAPDLLEKASAVLAMCDAIGDFSNGVTDATGSIDEGDVRAGELLEELRRAINKATGATA